VENLEGRDFALAMFGQWKLLRVFLLVVGLHSVCNSPLVVLVVGEPWNFYLKYLLLGFVGWILILLLLHDALKQARDAQAGNNMEAAGPGRSDRGDREEVTVS